jgi:anti-anti-sigma factor
MQLSVLSDVEGLVLVRCAGSIDDTGRKPGQDPLVDLLGPTVYTRRVLFDCESTSFIDSAGIGLLINWQKRFLRNGGRAVFYNIPPLIQQVFDLLHLDKVLNLARDEAAARAKGEAP